MEKRKSGMVKTIEKYQERFRDLDALTVDQLSMSPRLEKASTYRDYMYYNMLMIKYSGHKLISEIRKLRFEKFIKAHTELFYHGKKAEECSKEQVAWFNQQLA
jgi:hypothetical protein